MRSAAHQAIVRARQRGCGHRKDNVVAVAVLADELVVVLTTVRVRQFVQPLSMQFHLLPIGEMGELSKPRAGMR